MMEDGQFWCLVNDSKEQYRPFLRITFGSYFVIPNISLRPSVPESVRFNLVVILTEIVVAILAAATLVSMRLEG